MISFIRIVESDFKKLYFWLNEPHVKEFWDPDESFTFEQISSKYSKRILESKIDIFIFSVNDIEIGFIQTYFVDNPVSFKIIGISKGIDLYIGDKSYLYQGYGKLVIIEFIRNYVFSDEKVEFVVIDPEFRNKSAIKAYKKAGFEHVNSAYNEYEKAISYYMVMSRAKFFCNY